MSDQDLDDSEDETIPVVWYSAVSAFESSHTARITDVKWLPPTYEVSLYMSDTKQAESKVNS